MSLDFKGFNEAIKRYDTMVERVNKIVTELGLTNRYHVNCDHYGDLTLFGYNIDESTTDEALKKIIITKLQYEILAGEQNTEFPQ